MFTSCVIVSDVSPAVFIIYAVIVLVPSTVILKFAVVPVASVSSIGFAPSTLYFMLATLLASPAFIVTPTSVI